MHQNHAQEYDAASDLQLGSIDSSNGRIAVDVLPSREALSGGDPSNFQSPRWLQSEGNPTLAPAKSLYVGSASDLQRWSIDSTNGRISNAGCPNLAISSSKKKDASLDSIYFALENPRTQMAMGAVGSSDLCHVGMSLELQELVYGAPNQQFIFHGEKLISAMCPNLAIEIPSGAGSQFESC